MIYNDNNNASVEKSVYSPDLKSGVARHGGSTPPTRTKILNIMIIPKVVHIAWPDKEVIHNQSPIILNGLRNLIDLNPAWNVIIYDDNEIDTYLKNNLDISDYELIKDKHIVEKSDLWRLIKLYYDGGLYVDIDRFCNVKLSDIIDEDTRCVLPICVDWDFSQDFMLTIPNNPIMSRTIEMM